MADLVLQARGLHKAFRGQPAVDGVDVDVAPGERVGLLGANGAGKTTTLLMCLGAAMLGVLCVQGMSLLISAVFGRWAAVGITLAVLFGAPLVSTVVTVIIIGISQDPNKAHFLNYAFVNVLAPVSSISAVFGNGPAGPSGTGLGEFQTELITLAAWTIAFFAAAWLLFRRKEEAG